MGNHIFNNERKTKMTNAVLYIASGLMIVMGGYLIYKLIKKSSLINASKSWPAATATILKKEVVRRVSSKGQASYFPSWITSIP